MSLEEKKIRLIVDIGTADEKTVEIMRKAFDMCYSDGPAELEKFLNYDRRWYCYERGRNVGCSECKK